jgi:hypothetical protein
MSLTGPRGPMTEAEAHRLAAAEGLSLALAPGNASGFKGVSRNNGSISPKSGYCAQFCQGGKTVRLGSFSSAAEAALAYARHLDAVTTLQEREGRTPKRGRQPGSSNLASRGPGIRVRRRPYGGPPSEASPPSAPLPPPEARSARPKTYRKREHAEIMGEPTWHPRGGPGYPPPFHPPFSAAVVAQQLVQPQYDTAGYPLPSYRHQWPMRPDPASRSSMGRCDGVSPLGCTAPHPNHPHPNPNLLPLTPNP